MMNYTMRSLNNWFFLQFTKNINTSASRAAVFAEAAKKRNVKGKDANLKEEKDKATYAKCSIMNCDDHKIIRNALSFGNLRLRDTDIIVCYILDSKIKVPKFALESNKTSLKKTMTTIQKVKQIEETYPEIKFGKFTANDDKIIEQNWSKLMKETKLLENEGKVIKDLFEYRRDDKESQRPLLKKNIVGYYLAQGLSEVRLAAEVFQRARILLHSKNLKEFTAEEDKIIIDFVAKEGYQWAKLAELLGRTHNQSYGSHLRYRYEVLKFQKGSRAFHFTADEDEMLLKLVFAVNPSILTDGKLAKEDWDKIGEKLKRAPLAVSEHWRKVVEPLLKRYHAGTFQVDIRELLLNHLVKNRLYYSQNVDWKELAKLPKFAGCTPAFLQHQLSSLRSPARKMFPDISNEELTTEVMRRYFNMSDRSDNSKRIENQQNLIDFYVQNVLKKKV